MREVRNFFKLPDSFCSNPECENNEIWQEQYALAVACLRAGFVLNAVYPNSYRDKTFSLLASFILPPYKAIPIEIRKRAVRENGEL